MLDPIALMDELETYGFICTAGTLEWTPLWLDLRRAVIALRKENERLIQVMLQQRDE